ncbi:NHLP family bacteriocin export ABC transporter peptidase/permease/ATPase subunit [Acetobacterium woodii]|uniref:ABC transport system ATP-binding/permease/peptidase protein n=1 Tax=Acetobacterium woodii (strain ATCC 29683 / DSM 1030 / JCM 2381 / KCTC 1655 / WB1) TaxID=931626 RepID=H6LHM9_ACEWD|nr:NHLP family bacteriocin export ABC transporter peptidase/permease/ATPase subunit [Acetobacterium woodii]AFA47208.1 ABC transport system ATP-binding/permease/peptidase protein [Acetobacterium woodii DSM 1030]
MTKSETEKNRDEQKKLPKIAKVPVVLQMEAVECGVASLSMILAYYGRYETLETLRIDCGVSRDGVKAGNIARTARNYGLAAQGFVCTVDKLKEMEMPVIIHWDYSHFVVLEGFKKDKVYICDPASGQRVIVKEELEQMFTGVVIESRPGPAFKQAGEPPNVWKALFKRLSQTGVSPLIYAMMLGILLVIPGLVIANYAKIFVDYYLNNTEKFDIMIFVMILLNTVFLQAILNWLKEIALVRMESYIAINSAGAYLHHVLRLPVEFFNQRQSGDINSRMQSINTVASALSSNLTRIMVNLVTACLYLILLFQYSVQLTVIGIGITAINVFLLQYTAKKNADNNRVLLQYQGKSIGWIMVNLKSIETIKSIGEEDNFFNRIAGLGAETLEVEQRMGRMEAIIAVLPTLLTSVLTALIFMFGSEYVLMGTMTIGTFVAFNALMTGFTQPMSELVSTSASLQGMIADIQRLDDVEKYPEDIALESEKISLDGFDCDQLQGKIEIKDLTFGYNKLSEPIIQGLNLKLNAGGSIALVGSSGSGKSTIAKMITTLYQPWSGQICIDGIDIKAIPAELRYNTMSSVDQEIVMYSATVLDNITMWDETISVEDVIRATKDACIYEDILALPNAFDHVLSEGGKNLSGGQRQRLEIARALCKNPKILIMDEATSALDTGTEAAVTENIKRRGISTILVAHRLSTIRDCDEIIVLKCGAVAERGTHDELMALDGEYANLIRTEG